MRAEERVAIHYKKLSFKLGFIYILIFSAIACFNPYLTVFFQQKGLSYTEIGISYAALALTGVVTQPIWGFITDKYSSKRTILIILLISSSLLIYNFILAKEFISILLSIILIAAVHNSIIPMGDAFTYEIIAQHKELEYGKIRLKGSIGFAGMVLVIGQVITYTGIKSSYYVYSSVLIIGALLIFSIPVKGKGYDKKISLSDGGALLKDPKFSLFLFSIIFINIALGTNNSYIAILLQETGGDVSILGLLWFLMAMSEFPAFYYGRKILSKVYELDLYFIGVLFFILRFFLSGICTSFVPVLLIQTLQGVTFAFYLIAAFEYMNRIIAPEMRTTAMMIFSAVCGIGALIGNMGGGILLERISVFSLYKIIAVVCAVDLVFILILKRVDKKTA